ncbi:MAG: peptidylprolyl isomerase, partial [Deltaproteobacteria bacterium]
LLVFAAIILVFVFWGVGPDKGDQNDALMVATVDGESISTRDYADLYKREVEYYKNTFKDQFTEEMAKKMNLRQMALDVLINRALAIKQARAEGIKVAEKDVQEAIQAIPVFSKDGVFDKDLYFNVLKANRIKPADFEKNIEGDLYAGKVREMVVKGINVTDQDVKDAYLKGNRQYDMDYIAVDPSALRPNIKVSDEETKEYFQKNGAAFMTKPQVKAFYAFANYADLAGGAKVAGDEIKQYYENNLKEFETPPSVKARHILIRPDEKAADKEKAKQDAKKKAGEILEKLKSGGNFNELARRYSEDPGSAKQGGELGWLRKGMMIKSFEEAAFALKKGESSPVVETDFGYHIIQAEDKMESGVAPLKKAEESIRKVLTVKKSRSFAKDVFTALEKSFKEGKSVDELKKAVSAHRGVKSASTGLVSEDDRKSELVRNDALRDAAFNLRAGEVGNIIQTHSGFYIIKALERVEPHVPDYSGISSTVKDRIVSEKAMEGAAKKAGEILKRLQGGADIATVARDESYRVEQTGYFTMAQGMIPKPGIFTGDKEKLFELTPAAPYYGEVILHNGRFHIMKLRDTKEAGEERLVEMKEEIRSRLMQSRQEAALGKWLADLKGKAKIKVFEKNM